MRNGSGSLEDDALGDDRTTLGPLPSVEVKPEDDPRLRGGKRSCSEPAPDLIRGHPRTSEARSGDPEWFGRLKSERNASTAVTPDDCAEALRRFRERRPHVHCITNAVAQNVTANVLLAAGATPSTTIAPDEIADFVGFADALLVNLGTMDDARREAAALAVEVANGEGKPWALDPVFAQASRPRLALARELLARGPTLVRANERERAALLPGASQLVAVTGAVDRVVVDGREARVLNGTPLMARVTAMGCALTALAAGFLAANDDAFTATAAALAFFGVAGERAAAKAAGPGTFEPLLLDALANVMPDDLCREARLA